MPMRRREWEEPSERKDLNGARDRNGWHVRFLLDDGHQIWAGWFDDREDVDEFLFATVSGWLRYERELWKLPDPWFDPDVLDRPFYIAVDAWSYFASSPGTNQNHTIPADFSADNDIHVIGGGGGASMGTPGVRGPTGGAGGAWAKLVDAVVAIGATLVRNVGVGGLPGTGGGAGANGGDTWLRIDAGSTAPTTTAQGVLAKFGQGGPLGSNSTGGQAASCVGNFTNNGGNSYYSNSAGGGGAGGPNGAGGTGGFSTIGGGAGGGGANGGGSIGDVSSFAGTNGGNNFGGSGGGAGAAAGANTGGNGSNGGGGGGGGGSGTGGGNGGFGGQGSMGAEFVTSGCGSGGGGGGAALAAGAVAGNGGGPGAYGGGGGTGGYSPGFCGATGSGAQGLGAIRYTPKPLLTSYDLTGISADGSFFKNPLN